MVSVNHYHGVLKLGRYFYLNRLHPLMHTREFIKATENRMRQLPWNVATFHYMDRWALKGMYEHLLKPNSEVVTSIVFPNLDWLLFVSGTTQPLPTHH